MLQIYFLSISLNLAAGFILASDGMRGLKSLASLADILSTRRAKLVFGPSVLIVGFLTLFIPADAGPLILGDLIPSIAGMAMGIALLFEVFRVDAVFPSEPADRQERRTPAYRTALGILGMGVAVLHFFLGERPLL